MLPRRPLKDKLSSFTIGGPVSPDVAMIGPDG